jgi:hypothetical protein
MANEIASSISKAALGNAWRKSESINIIEAAWREIENGAGEKRW